MARLPRIVIPFIPHHITQRGNPGERTFFEDGDYELYLDLLAAAARAARVAIWSYCLMPNHVTSSSCIGRRRALANIFAPFIGITPIISTHGCG